jgi:hypothetical protein
MLAVLCKTSCRLELQAGSVVEDITAGLMDKSTLSLPCYGYRGNSILFFFGKKQKKKKR